MLIDARSLAAGAEFVCDVCVVGAGPAGIALVDRLRQSGLCIVLLESGGFNLELPTQSLYRGEIHGDPYFRLDACRWRLFGGSSNRWGGWCRPLEPVDFERREWLPHSGWPIDAEVLRPYHDDAARLFELPNARFDLADWQQRLPTPLPLDGASFVNNVFQHCAETNFGDTCLERLRSAPAVTTLLHANLTAIRLAPVSQRVASLEVGTLVGRRFSVHPKAVVLACGGIENARLLLASCADRPAGLGNEFDTVGRFFMEHLHVPAGHMITSAVGWDREFFRKAVFDDVRLRGVLTPTAAAQARHHLLATSIAIEGPGYSFGTPFCGWPPPVTFGPVRRYRVLRKTRFAPAAEFLKQLAERAQAVPKKIATRSAANAAARRAGPLAPAERVYSIYFRSEQAPDPDNRVRLSTERDALGMPRSQLDWSLKAFDTGSIERWLAVFDGDLKARGLGRVVHPLPGWQAGVIGGPHHMGSTRMSHDPRRGVVDADCRVHSLDNLYVAGSSVFATSGYANPTFALVTLALRLADTLRTRLQGA